MGTRTFADINKMAAPPGEPAQLFRPAQSSPIRAMTELVFEVTQEADSGFVAECLTESIVTQADDWEELRRNVREGVGAYFFDQPLPGAKCLSSPPSSF